MLYPYIQDLHNIDKSIHNEILPTDTNEKKRCEINKMTRILARAISKKNVT